MSLVVPNVVGLYYPDAQLRLLGAGFYTAPPVPVLNPANPGYVVAQNVAAGSSWRLPVQVQITVSGFSVVNQPGNVVAVL